MDFRTLDASRTCFGYEKDIEFVSKLYPTTLYHVSANKNAVCSRGLMTPNELAKKGIYTRGIGGANSDFISFTYNYDLARDYALDMLTLSKIANGILTPNNIEKHLNNQDMTSGLNKKPSQILGDLFKGDDFKMGYIYEYEGVLDDLERNKILDRKSIYDHIKGLNYDDCEAFITKNNFRLPTDIVCDPKNIEVWKSSKFATPIDEDWRPVSVDERQKILFDMIRRNYFMARGREGGKPNPTFFVYYENYKKIKPSDIGIFKVFAYLPRPIEEYFEIDDFRRYGEYTDYYPDDSPPGKEKSRYDLDWVRISRGESEVRMHPKYTTMLEEITLKRM